MPTSLNDVLAQRKAQVSVARTNSLAGLRGLGVVDSDDDDDDEDETAAATAPAQGKGGVDLGRAPNLLASGTLEDRKRTLASLAAAELTPDQLKPLLRPLLLRFSDVSEACRDHAVALFGRWQRGSDASDVSGALPFLMPVMVERLGSDKDTEPSEEVRAALVTLMRDVLLKCRALIKPYLNECGAIALGCCRDQHPEVIKGVCELMSVIAVDVLRPLLKRTDKKAVKPFTQKLLDAILPHVRHRHAAVRLQVLCALEELLLCGAGQSVETLTGWRLKNNVPIAEFYGKGSARINYLADLSRDRSVPVRRQLIKCVARWISDMDGEDLYEQEVRIVAYLVSGLTDDDDETAAMAMREIERLGQLYVETNIKDYKEKIEYGHADEAAETAAISIARPPPLTERRPSLGARERVGQHFRSLIHPICAELELWTSAERLQSARLLEMLLVYVEHKVTEFAHQLLPALAKGMDEDNPDLAPLVARCAAQFAQFTQPEEYMPLLLTAASADSLNPYSQRTQHVALLVPLLRGMRAPAAARTLHLLAPDLCAESLVATQHTALRRAVRALLAELPAALANAAAPLASMAAEGAPPLAPSMLLGVLLYVASDGALQPKAAAAVSLAEGLEDVTEAAPDESAWQRAAEEAKALAAPILASPALAPNVSDRTWARWRAALNGRLEESIAANEEAAEFALRLLELVAPAGPSGRAAAAAGAPKPQPAGPRVAVAIAECDGFTDDEDDVEEPASGLPTNEAVLSKPGHAAQQSAADDFDDFDDGDLD